MIVFDLDNTLADASHRQHFVDPSKNLDYEYSNCFAKDGKVNFHKFPQWQYKNTGEKWKPNWRAFYDACDQDTPIMPTINIFRSLQLLDHEIQIWSGRCESVRDKTEKWLSDYLFYSGQYPLVLKMRPIGYSIPDHELKMKWLDKTYEDTKWGSKTTIECVFDDNESCCNMWIRRGIFVFDVCQGKGDF